MHRTSLPIALLLLAIAGQWTFAHEHHTDEIPEGEAISAKPLDTILWIHILIQIFTFGILFPTGMVLGMVHSRWHIPVQTLAVILAVVGYFLGHAHGGRQFDTNVHASFANWLMLMLIAQVVLGAYLRLHLEKGNSWQHTQTHGPDARSAGEGIPRGELGADALWRDNGAGILQRRSFGPVRGALYYGERIYCLRNHSHDYTGGGANVAQALGTKSGIFPTAFSLPSGGA